MAFGCIEEVDFGLAFEMLKDICQWCRAQAHHVHGSRDPNALDSLERVSFELNAKNLVRIVHFREREGKGRSAVPDTLLLGYLLRLMQMTQCHVGNAWWKQRGRLSFGITNNNIAL
ncbi:Uncharacterised protein [Pseudomonas luteola]|uniref:Uncharacterized protein n=1 Tax=Pseudomonas luteola TaxID=47886 RepID=A0A2X2CE54_PSELU|nr:Uncharacterised protein [Pseudomonas luteola]